MSDLRNIVDRIESLEEEIKGLNSDKSDIYAEAKSNGFDVKALKAVIAHRRKDPKEVQEQTAIFQTYMTALESGTPIATRVRTREAA